MIIVTVKLKSAVDGRTEKLGEMIIFNDGSSQQRTKGNYEAIVYRKPNFFNWKSYDKNVTRRARVENYARLHRPVWDLVGLALKNMGYGK